MPEKTIRVGLIGAGGNTTKLHIPGLKKQAGVEIVAVANRTRGSGQRVASEFGIAQVQDDWQALLDDDGIDAVCIGTWPYMHSTLLIAALEAGKHVLCEARMAMDHDDARDMLDAARRHPALTATSRRSSNRFNPSASSVRSGSEKPSIANSSSHIRPIQSAVEKS